MSIFVNEKATSTYNKIKRNKQYRVYMLLE